MEFSCARCGHKTTRKWLLQKHLKTVNPCQQVLSDETRESLLKKLEKQYNDDAKACEGCQKQFNTVSNYYNHRKKCKQYLDLQTSQAPSTSSQPNQSNNVVMSNAQVEKMLTLLEQLVNKPTQPSTSNTITNNNIVQINQQNNNNIILNSIGKESHAHLTGEQMTSFIQNREIIDLIKTINFNPDVPENHNIKRITSSKDWYKNQFLSVYNENGEWTNSVKEKVLETVVNNGFRVMYKHFFDAIQSNPMNVTEETADFTRWFNENFTNPKSFIKDVFALTLDDKFLSKNDQH
jgi:hypothetical protein